VFNHFGKQRPHTLLRLYIFVSHADTDHFSLIEGVVAGAVDVLEFYGVRVEVCGSIIWGSAPHPKKGAGLSHDLLPYDNCVPVDNTGSTWFTDRRWDAPARCDGDPNEPAPCVPGIVDLRKAFFGPHYNKAGFSLTVSTYVGRRAVEDGNNLGLVMHLAVAGVRNVFTADAFQNGDGPLALLGPAGPGGGAAATGVLPVVCREGTSKHTTCLLAQVVAALSSGGPDAATTIAAAVVEAEGTSVLAVPLGGAAPARCPALLAELADVNVRSEVVTLPHHGSHCTDMSEFFKIFAWQHVSAFVVSAAGIGSGSGNNRHPRCDAIVRLLEMMHLCASDGPAAGEVKWETDTSAVSPPLLCWEGARKPYRVVELHHTRFRISRRNAAMTVLADFELWPTRTTVKDAYVYTLSIAPPTPGAGAAAPLAAAPAVCVHVREFHESP